MATYQKGSETINLTPEQERTFYGGIDVLTNSGWSKVGDGAAAPVAPSTPPASMVSPPIKDMSTEMYINGNPANGLNPAYKGPIAAGATPGATADFLPAGFQEKQAADLKALQELSAKASSLTPEELAAIDEEARLGGAKFDVLIAQAQEAKRQGNAQALIRAGQRGGFESTQTAGAAALAPTEGGTFRGAGGGLEKIASAYDANISNLQIQKDAAIQEAKSALKEARLKGKQADFTRAKDLFELANKSSQDLLDLQYKKVQALKTMQDYFKSSVDYAANTIASNLIGAFTGNEDTDFAMIERAAQDNNIDVGAIQGAIRKIQDEQSFYKASDITAMMKALPEGQSQTIVDPNTGRRFTFTGTASPDTFQVTNDKGEVSIVDKQGNIVAKTAAGVGKTKTQASSITINAVGARTPAILNGKQIGYQAYNDKTGKIQNYDVNGTPVGAWPEGTTLGTFASGNPSEEDQLVSDIETLLK